MANAERCLRLGLCYVRGLREEAARAILAERARHPFTGIEELARRVPELHKDEMNRLAEVGALNFIADFGMRNAEWGKTKLRTPQSTHRRGALWQAGRAGRPAGPLLDELDELEKASPLARMTPEERLGADFRGTGLTIGKHPMALRRAELDRLRVLRAAELPNIGNGRPVRVAGCVIARQRPGTANGFLFLSLEDETGIANAIVTPDLFEKNRMVLIGEPFLLIDGVLQNQENVVSVKARRIQALAAPGASPPSHDFH